MTDRFSYPRHQLFGRPAQLGLQTLTRRVYVLLHGFLDMSTSTSRYAQTFGLPHIIHTHMMDDI